jgi:uncharacterized protein (DUF305 family)
VAERAVNPAVVTLAEEIAAEDAESVDAMTGLLEVWDEEIPEEIALTEMDHSQMSHEGIGMGFLSGISDDQVTLLASLDGEDFDAKFLKFMLTHRGAGVAMADGERIYGQYGPAIKLGRAMASTQSGQMDMIFELCRETETRCD